MKINFICNSKTILKRVFNSRSSKNNKIDRVLKNILEPEINKKVLKPIELENRIIYPIIEIITINNEYDGVILVEIFPVALVVKESDNKYAISLTKDEINQKEFIEMV